MRRSMPFLLSVSLCLLTAIGQSSAEGALAIGSGPGGLWFTMATNRSPLQWAEDAAMRRCLEIPMRRAAQGTLFFNQVWGVDCHVAFTFRRTCIAIALVKLPNGRAKYTWLTRESLSEAKSSVMSHCDPDGATCELKGSLCDYIQESMAPPKRGQDGPKAAPQEMEGSSFGPSFCNGTNPPDYCN
jgi:Domain of unknown function (DUF4189)